VTTPSLLFTFSLSVLSPASAAKAAFTFVVNVALSTVLSTLLTAFEAVLDAELAILLAVLLLELVVSFVVVDGFEEFAVDEFAVDELGFVAVDESAVDEFVEGLVEVDGVLIESVLFAVLLSWVDEGVVSRFATVSVDGKP